MAAAAPIVVQEKLLVRKGFFLVPERERAKREREERAPPLASERPTSSRTP
jgi:hypothetical protein